MDTEANKTQTTTADQPAIAGHPQPGAADQRKKVVAAGSGVTDAEPPKSYVSLPPDCKGCTGNIHDDAQIKRVLAALSRHSEACVDDVEYAERLAACESCASLANGTTCLLCGCYVAVRAKLRSNHCPMPGGARW